MDREQLEQQARQQLRNAHFYENWRVSAAIGAIAGAAFVLLLQAIF